MALALTYSLCFLLVQAVASLEEVTSGELDDEKVEDPLFAQCVIVIFTLLLLLMFFIL